MNRNDGRDGQPQRDPWGESSSPQQGGDWQAQQGGQRARQPKQRKQRGGRGRGKSALKPGETPAAEAIPEERLSFIRRTYAWLTGAVFLCVAMMVALWQSPLAEPVITFVATTNWLIVLGLFLAFTWIGDWMAHRVESLPFQFIGMLVGVGAYAILFTYLVVASGALVDGQGVDASVFVHAGLLTLVTFGALTAIVFTTKQDFSVLRIGIMVMSILALGAIVAGVLFGFTLGLGFAVAMVGLSSAIIVYQTSNILHHYPTDRHVGAALALFTAVGMLFWYLALIFMDG